jgi:predicted ATP-grasp superfamily ATP-dependent carboligase
MMRNMPVPERTGDAGVRWMRLSTDLPAAIHEMLRGRLALGAYLRSFRGPIQFALMAADDPLPGLLDLPLFAYKKFCHLFQSPLEDLPLKTEGMNSNG